MVRAPLPTRILDPRLLTEHDDVDVARVLAELVLQRDLVFAGVASDGDRHVQLRHLVIVLQLRLKPARARYDVTFLQIREKAGVFSQSVKA